jgi:hypothetical protein
VTAYRLSGATNESIPDGHMIGLDQLKFRMKFWKQWLVDRCPLLYPVLDYIIIKRCLKIIREWRFILRLHRNVTKCGFRMASSNLERNFSLYLVLPWCNLEWRMSGFRQRRPTFNRIMEYRCKFHLMLLDQDLLSKDQCKYHVRFRFTLENRGLK